MAKLNTTVYVMQGGEVRGFGPDDDVPEDVARQIGAHAWEDGEHPYPASGSEAGGPPPKAGAGSSVDAWAAYAADQGVEVPEDAKRDEIIAALEAAGKPVE